MARVRIFVFTLALFCVQEHSVNASSNETEECFEDSYSYMSTRTRTVSGKKCQRWDKQYPHEHTKEDNGFIDGSKCKAKNYCRDPDGTGYPWCYTTDPDTRWESCGIPYCHEGPRNTFNRDCYHITDKDRAGGYTDEEICDMKGNSTFVCSHDTDVPNGCEGCNGCCQTKDCSYGYISSYMGTWHRSGTGRECQRWDSQSPHNHDNYHDWQFPDSTSTAASNYCRDPDDTGLLWCYTMDPTVRWESCEIPEC